MNPANLFYLFFGKYIEKVGSYVPGDITVSKAVDSCRGRDQRLSEDRGRFGEKSYGKEKDHNSH